MNSRPCKQAYGRQFIRNNSPFPVTFVVTCCNAVNAYLASKLAFDYGCYEKDNRNFVRGTAEKVADLYVAMLKEKAKDNPNIIFTGFIGVSSNY